MQLKIESKAGKYSKYEIKNILNFSSHSNLVGNGYFVKHLECLLQHRNKFRPWLNQQFPIKNVYRRHHLLNSSDHKIGTNSCQLDAPFQAPSICSMHTEQNQIITTIWELRELVYNILLLKWNSISSDGRTFGVHKELGE
jgi:hypothetical protein